MNNFSMEASSGISESLAATGTMKGNGADDSSRLKQGGRYTCVHVPLLRFGLQTFPADDLTNLGVTFSSVTTDRSSCTMTL